MKTIIALTFMVAAFAGSVSASDYEEVMKANIEKIFKTQTAEELVALANQFERIAQAEKDKWLPGYYAAYCYVESSHHYQGDAREIHNQLDKAQAIMDELLNKYENESEINALQSLIYQLRITDMAKGAKYSRLSHEMLDKAERLDPDNPRAYYLRGTNLFHTPEFFGGGAEKAKPYFEKAAKLFASRNSENEIAPQWGEAHNNELLGECK